MWVISTSRETVEVTLPSLGNSPSRRVGGAFTYRRSKLLESELQFYDGHWATDPIRTFIDIARHHGFVEGLVAADYLLRRGESRMLIDETVHAMGRCKGIGTVRRCLEHAIPDSQSPYESYARALLIEAGIGPVRAQFRVDEFFADLCVDGWLLIEIDGDEKYNTNIDEVRLAEIKREKQIGNRGFKIMRYSPDFLLKHPERFVREVKEALAARDLLVERIG